MARPKILVFQHVPYEPLGTLDPLLKNAGFRIRYVNFGRDPSAIPSLDGYVALIVLGGPMNADQVDDYPHLATELALIAEALDRDISILGICLGDIIELPSNVVHLASSANCPAQAFRHGQHAYGFQFHLEADGALIERWLDVPQHQSVFDSGEFDPAHIRARISSSIDPLMALSNDTFSRWIERFELRPRRRHLPSR
jgi:GMP synthase (glutamine-hydrolysing)